MLPTPIYLDNNATTKPDPRVVEAMMPTLCEIYGNAASNSHPYGWQAQAAVDEARERVADLINAYSREIVFTSGATESNNLALRGVMEHYAAQGNHFITVVTEHKAILDTATHLEKMGKRVTVLPVDRYGQVKPDQIADAITDQTVLVSVMRANNEIGTLQPLGEIGRICRERGVLLHTDATQAVGKIPVDVDQLNVDLLSLTAHKMYGPKGVGALYVRCRNPRVRLAIQMDGGGHEQGRRSGTLNVPGIVGLGKAAQIAKCELERDICHTENLRDKLQSGLQAGIPDLIVNGHPLDRLPNTLNVSIPGVIGDALLAGLDRIAVSSGSACSSASPKPSYVLRALGLSDELAFGSLRFGLSRYTTGEEIDIAIEHVVSVVKRVKADTEIESVRP